MDYSQVPIRELDSLTRSALIRQGHSEDEAAEIAEVLLYAELRGNDQGVVKLIGPGLPKDPDAGEMRVENRTGLSALVHGHRNAGILVLRRATAVAQDIAAEQGISIVGTNGTGTSTGCVGYYANTLARSGFVGVLMAGSKPVVAPYGSYEPLLGTNPIAIGLPNEPDPIVFDMATSAITWYSVVAALAAGHELPANAAFDRRGELTTDPAAAMDGALTTFDRGYKGWGLSMVVELLTGPFIGASYAGFEDPASNWGNLVITIDPDLLGGREAFSRGVAAFAQRVRDAKRLAGVDRVLLPGDRGNAHSTAALESGVLELPTAIYEGLVTAAKR
jgi:L-2-hydroxycarboxylate dehydrogenase (NAD+)